MPDQFSVREDISTIISLLPVHVSERKPGLIPGFFEIPPVKNPHEDVEILQVRRARFAVYIDENRPALIVPEPSDRVCASIVRDYKVAMPGYSADVSEPGLFWVPGDYSAEAIKKQFNPQLINARKLQDQWFIKLVELADDDWQQYHSRRMVSGLQRKACEMLGLTRDWNIVIDLERQLDLDMTPCKFCRGPVHRDAIVCQHCTGVLNVERYQKEFVSAGSVTTTK
jgi:hypothetical protein